MVRASLLGMALIGVMVGPSLAGEKYASKDGKFSVVFQEKPKESTKELPLPTGKSTMYIAAVEISKDHAQLVMYNDLGEDAGTVEAQTILKGARDGAAGMGRLVSDKEISYGKDKVPGRECVLEKDKFLIRVRLYLKDSRLYQVMIVSSSKDDLTSKEADKFLDSFEITK
jgi:hypothetical protein